MTTIAANLEQMAADSALVMGDTRAHCCKIVRIKDMLVGCAGDAALGEKFLAWLRGGNKPAMEKDSDFCALVLTKAGIFHYEFDCEPTLLKNPFWAIGTGGTHALTAMNMGASPEGAVEQAIAFDINSGPPIDVFTLKKGPMKLLLLDIETAPNLAHVWGLWQQNVGINQLIDAGYVLCWAAKWYGEKEVMFDSIHQSKPHKMLTRIHKLLSECDAAVHYNGKSFDIPTLNKEFIVAGMPPPSPYKQVDLCQVAKSTFRFPSNKLAYIAKALGVAEKKNTRGHELWIGCMQNDPECWAEMEEYNRGDVVSLEEVYERMRPWVRIHPNHGLYDEPGIPVCTNCGSGNLIRRGFARTAVSKYARYQCKDCGTWVRGADNELPKEDRQQIMRRVVT